MPPSGRLDPHHFFCGLQGGGRRSEFQDFCDCREEAGRQRLEALKANDFNSYMSLVRPAGNSRMNKLLQQTDACLKQLTARLKLNGNALEPMVELDNASGKMGADCWLKGVGLCWTFGCLQLLSTSVGYLLDSRGPFQGCQHWGACLAGMWRPVALKQLCQHDWPQQVQSTLFSPAYCRAPCGYP